jgi:glycosyltransferase involved in cell wall biosynthesis
MRILQWCPSFYAPGGRGELVKDAVRQMSERGHEVSLVTRPSSLRGCEPGRDENVAPTCLLPSDSGYSPESREPSGFSLTDLRTFIETHQPEIIHCHEVDPLSNALLATVSRALDIPVVYTEHESPDALNPHFVARRRAVPSLTKVIVFPSEYSRHGWKSVFPDDKTKAFTIPNGVPRSHAVRSDSDEKSVFFSGRHVSEKGLGILLAAWPIVLSALPEASLRIAGTGSQTEHLQRFATLLGVDLRVRWLGWLSRDDNRLEAASASVVVVPSIWQEPFGLVAAEASMAGRPVVASRVGGIPDIVLDHETGLLVPPGDSVSLAVAIRSLLAKPDWANTMGQAGHRHITDKFSIDVFIDRQVDLYSTVVSQWDRDRGSN